MNISTDTKREKVILILIFAFALFVRWVLLANSDDFHGVSAGRILHAELILQNKLLTGEFYNPVHPPLHLLLLIWSLKLFGQTLLVPRLVSLFFGTAMIFPAYFYLKRFFSYKIAIFSIIGMAFYSEHLVYSVIATSETCYNFFLFTGFFLFTEFLNNSKTRNLCFSALAVSLATMCRYEGLVFIPLMSLFILKDKKNAVIFLAVSMSMPLAWMWVNYLFGKNPLHFLSTNDFTVPLQFNWIRSMGMDVGFKYKLLFWPAILLKNLGAPVFFFGLFGVIYCLRKKEKFFPAALFLLLFVIFIVRTLQERLYLQPRYSITLGLMLIPFAFYFLSKINILGRKIFWEVSAFVLLCAMSLAVKHAVLEEPLCADYFIQNVARYIHETVRHGENIIVDHCGDEKYREPLKLLCGINPRQFILAPYTIARNGVWVVDKARFICVLKKFNIKILVYSPLGELSGILPLKEGVSSAAMEGFYFKLKYRSAPYFVYEVDEIHEAKEKIKGRTG